MNIFNILNVSHVGIITTLENFKLSKKSLISLNRKFIFSPTNNWFQTTITLLGNNLQILGFCHILSSVSAEISNIAKLQFQFLNRIILAWKVKLRSELLVWIMDIVNLECLISISNVGIFERIESLPQNLIF